MLCKYWLWGLKRSQYYFLKWQSYQIFLVRNAESKDILYEQLKHFLIANLFFSEVIIAKQIFSLIHNSNFCNHCGIIIFMMLLNAQQSTILGLRNTGHLLARYLMFRASIYMFLSFIFGVCLKTRIFQTADNVFLIKRFLSVVFLFLSIVLLHLSTLIFTL